MNPQAIIASIEAEIAQDVELVNGEDEQEHTQRHWPDRIERQADAFRRILARHQPAPMMDASNVLPYPTCTTCHKGEPYDWTHVPWPCEEVKDLAAIYEIGIPQ